MDSPTAISGLLHIRRRPGDTSDIALGHGTSFVMDRATIVALAPAFPGVARKTVSPRTRTRRRTNCDERPSALHAGLFRAHATSRRPHAQRRADLPRRKCGPTPPGRCGRPHPLLSPGARDGDQTGARVRSRSRWALGNELSAPDSWPADPAGARAQARRENCGGRL